MEEKDTGTEEGIKITCAHESHRTDWLPMLGKRHELTLAPHPFCDRCGLVRNIGPDRPRKLGFYTDVLSKLEGYLENEHSRGGRHKLIEAQKRLIVKEMEEDELFQDLYGAKGSAQEDKFVEIFRKFRSDVDEQEIRYYLDLG